MLLFVCLISIILATSYEVNDNNDYDYVICWTSSSCGSNYIICVDGHDNNSVDLEEQHDDDIQTTT